jgi:hypothetical protein
VTRGQAAFPALVGKAGGRSFANAESSLAVHIGRRTRWSVLTRRYDAGPTTRGFPHSKHETDVPEADPDVARQSWDQLHDLAQ